jgi:rubrerythrin
MQKYIAEKNVENSERQLAETTDEATRDTLKTLIKEERRKLSDLRRR